VIPVEVTQAPWRYTTSLDLLDHWQSLAAGLIAVLAAVVEVQEPGFRQDMSPRVGEWRWAARAGATYRAAA
jgi:hypothetical protein